MKIEKRSLNDCLSMVIDRRGVTPKKLGSDWVEDGFPVLSANNVKSTGLQKLDDVRCIDESTYRKWMKEEICRGDILLTSEAPAGEVYVWDSDEKIVVGQRLYALRVKEDVNPWFLAYYLRSSKGRTEISNKCSGSTVFGISAKTFDFIEVMLPGRDVQDKIACTLRSLEKKKEVNLSLTRKLGSLARFIYDYWFVQFDFPDEKGRSYKSSGGRMVWNEELKKLIPDGWSVRNISDIIRAEKMGDWGKAVPSGNHTLRVKCIRGADFPGLLGEGEFFAPDRYILQRNESKSLEPGDLIIEISGGSPTQSTGRICYVNNQTLSRFDCPVITSNFCKAISLKNGDMGYWFFITWEILYEAGLFFNYEGKTTGIKNLLFSSLCDNYKVVLPDERILRKFQVMMEDIFSFIQNDNCENMKISDLEGFLLSLLMSGQASFR